MTNLEATLLLVFSMAGRWCLLRVFTIALSKALALSKLRNRRNDFSVMRTLLRIYGVDVDVASLIAENYWF